ncbi:hypothetical protein JCM10212_004825 [Sporobolomyces blumeae]
MLERFVVRSILSLNLAAAIALTPLAVLLLFLVVYVLTHPSLFRSPLHSRRKKPLTETQRNTLLNRNENGGTGVWSRKWRKHLAAFATTVNLVASAQGQSSDDDDDGDDEQDDATDSEDGAGRDEKKKLRDRWNLVVRPAPLGLKGCLKREGSFEFVKEERQRQLGSSGSGSASSGEDEPSPRSRSRIAVPPALVEEDLPTPTPSPCPSPILSTSSPPSTQSPPSRAESHLASPPPSLSPSPPPFPTSPPSPPFSPAITSPTSPLSPSSPSHGETGSPLRPKRVQIVEPSLVELEALRTLWDDPNLQEDVGGYGGIAGFRKTRDHYARGQGGRGRTVASKGATPPPTRTTPEAAKEGKNTQTRGKVAPDREGGNGEPSEEDLVTTEEDEASPTPARPRSTTALSSSSSGTRRSLALSNMSSSQRSSSSSLSPSPSGTNRRPGGGGGGGARRTLSPNGPGANSKRAPSPLGKDAVKAGSSGSGGGIAASVVRGDEAGVDSSPVRVSPRWVKTKPTSTPASSSSSRSPSTSVRGGKLSASSLASSASPLSSKGPRFVHSRSPSGRRSRQTSPAHAAAFGSTNNDGQGQDDEDESEADRLARERAIENGGISATVTDDEDDEYEDVPPTPPTTVVGLPSVAGAGSSSSTSGSSGGPARSDRHGLSPCLELLSSPSRTNKSRSVHHDDSSDAGDDGRTVESPMSGSESVQESPTPSGLHLESASTVASKLPNLLPSPPSSPISPSSSVTSRGPVNRSTPKLEITPASPANMTIDLPPL